MTATGQQGQELHFDNHKVTFQTGRTLMLGLSMYELSLPEPMLSLSMLILAMYPVAALDVTIRNPNQN